MKLTENFTITELISSHIAKAHNIDNYPPQEAIENLKLLCEKVLQPARDWLGQSIKVNSGYRSLALNTRIKGAKNSQHMKGQAADITCYNNAILFDWMRKNLTFDQCIAEYGDSVQPGWIHVSYNKSGNRNEILIINEKGVKRL